MALTPNQEANLAEAFQLILDLESNKAASRIKFVIDNLNSAQKQALFDLISARLQEILTSRRDGAAVRLTLLDP
jgi:hypothetical protein